MALRADDVDLGRDRDLVDRHQAGDATAFDDLYRRYFARLERFCLRQTGDRHEAEEVAQEAFVRAYRSMASLDGEKKFYPWVTVIARRIVIDRRRKTARVDLADEVDLGTVEIDNQHLFDAVDHALVRSALDQVGPRHREVLRLREEQGLSYAAVAERLDVPVTTVEALLHRARKALRREYARVNGTGRGLYGLPVLGWLATRAGGLRSRIAERWVEIAAVAAPATVAAVTAAVVVLPADAPSSAAVAAAPPAAIDGTTAIEPLPSPDTTTVTVQAPTTTTTVAPAPEPAPATTPTTVAPSASAGPVDVYTGPDGRDQAADEAADMPTNGEVGPATFGAAIARSVNDALEFGTESDDSTDDPAPLLGGTP